MNKDILIDNSIIITSNSNKDKIIKYISSLDKLYNIRVMDINELIDNYFFKYDERTIYFIMHKYNVKYDIALIYLKNMYYIDTLIDDIKISKLYYLKQELDTNNLLIYNTKFKEYLKQKQIIVLNVKESNLLSKILNNYNYRIIEDKKEYLEKEIIEHNTLDDEVIGVANKIVELIRNNVDINKIYLTNLNDEYRLIIKRIFKFFKIPVSLNTTYSLYSTNTCTKFINLYDEDMEKTLSELEKTLNENEIIIFNKIVNIVNKYAWCNNYLDIKELIIHDLKSAKIKEPVKNNSVHEAKLDFFNDDEYVFLLGFNQGIIPTIYKNEDYLSDKEKEKLGIETSTINNLREKDNVITIIKSIKHLFISYKIKTLTDTYSISNINDELNFPVLKNNSFDYDKSHLYNKLSLASSLDLFNKYGTINDNLVNLYNNYLNINYRSYNNKFTGIDKNKLAQYLDNKLLLSYSSLDNYNRCNFRYYLGNILKLNIYEETFMQLIGNLFHYVLSKAFLEDFNYDECFDNYIKRELTKKERFFIKKLKQELKFIIETIKEHNTHSSLDEELYEDKIYVNLEGNIKVTFMGIIDKLKYKEIDNKQIVVIIDYKTGNPNLNLNNIIYGIQMQLPIYLYLAKKHPKFNNIEIAGFYLQKILNNEIVAEKKVSYETLKKKNLLLQGYSNDNINILSLFDDSYEDSEVVKSLKTSSKGFYAYSKVLDSHTINELIKITEEQIKKSSNDILEAKFDINPKRIGFNNLGCEFCTFKDICFKNEKDIVNLKEYKNMEFLGGDENA